MSTECIVVFPEGISVLPWMVCGTNEIGEATAEKIGDTRIVLWAAHGIFGTGRDMDEVFGLIETVEKAAENLHEDRRQGDPPVDHPTRSSPPCAKSSASPRVRATSICKPRTRIVPGRPGLQGGRLCGPGRFFARVRRKKAGVPP